MAYRRNPPDPMASRADLSASPKSEIPRITRLPNARLDGVRILAVDDQADTLAVIHRMFTRAGADVRTALDVAAAFAMLRDWEPACIVSDIGMPEQDGYSFMRQLRDMPPPLRNVPTVALTAFARDSDRALAIEAGFTDHLAKPVDTAALLQKVAMLTHRV